MNAPLKEEEMVHASSKTSMIWPSSRSGLTRRMMLGAAAVSPMAIRAAVPEPSTGPLLELRQYKIVAGKRDTMIDLFERNFIESQEAVGAVLLGQFRDLDDPSRFTWLRGFSDMATRKKALEAFYFGPVWRGLRETANPMLEDNDNALLLRPVTSGSGLKLPDGLRPGIGIEAPVSHLIVATIHYLWKQPSEGFSLFFEEHIQPALAGVGLPVMGSYVCELDPNDFPQLPVRQESKVFVWFTRVRHSSNYERRWRAFRDKITGKGSIQNHLDQFEERGSQVLHLAPTRRSWLR